MYAEKCDLRGKRGVQRLERIGPYAVIANRALHEEGKSSRFAVVNEPEAWVDSVHPSEARAISTALSLAE